MGSKIVFNGQEYSGVDDMPLEVRRAYEQVMNMLADRDGDGVPDAVQNSDGTFTADVVTKIVVNGREYNSIDEMPEDVRRMYELARSAQDDGQGGGTFIVESGEDEIAATGRMTWQGGDRQKLPPLTGGMIGALSQDPRLVRAMVVIAIMVVVIAVLIVLSVLR
ncbi:MAG: hypothetical protein GXP25_00425 [Planctomycetes bacterium]|nr:hypothetical protein [Planctomycetota bacterium]